MPTFTLHPHPDTPCPFVASLDVAVDRHRGGGLRCQYDLRGNVDRLSIPGSIAQPARTDGLWRETCFEIFVKAATGSIYDEFNFSPSGHWAAYRFERYRSGGVELELGEPPLIVCRHDRSALQLIASIANGDPASGSMQVGISAVLKDRDGAIYYWALRHPPGKPDFHHDASFVGTLP